MNILVQVLRLLEQPRRELLLLVPQCVRPSSPRPNAALVYVLAVAVGAPGALSATSQVAFGVAACDDVAPPSWWRARAAAICEGPRGLRHAGDTPRAYGRAMDAVWGWGGRSVP